MDCDEDANKQTCGQYGVQGFPTLKTFKPSAKKGKPVIEGELPSGLLCATTSC